MSTKTFYTQKDGSIIWGISQKDGEELASQIEQIGAVDGLVPQVQAQLKAKGIDRDAFTPPKAAEADMLCHMGRARVTRAQRFESAVGVMHMYHAAVKGTANVFDFKWWQDQRALPSKERDAAFTKVNSSLGQYRQRFCDRFLPSENSGNGNGQAGDNPTSDVQKMYNKATALYAKAREMAKKDDLTIAKEGIALRDALHGFLKERYLLKAEK